MEGAVAFRWESYIIFISVDGGCDHGICNGD